MHNGGVRDGGQVMQEDQKLMVEFQDYPNVLIRMLNNCIKEPHSHLAVFVMQRDVNARLDFIQVSFVPEGFAFSPSGIVSKQATARFIGCLLSVSIGV